MDAIPTGFCVCRADSGLVRYNRRAVELWGRTPPLGDPNDQHGSSFRRYSAAGEPLPFDATPVAMALRTGEPVVGAELVIERPDGSRVPVLMNATPLRDQTGRIEGAVCSFQELTEHKRAEAALRASEAELQSVINRTPFMLVRCSRDLRYRFVSAAYAQLIGRDRDEIVGKTIAEMLGPRGFDTLRPSYRGGAARRAGGVRMRTRFPRNRQALPLHRLPARARMRRAASPAGSLRCSTSPNAKACEAELRALSEKLEAEVEKRTLERDRIWNVSEDLLAVSQFRRLFPQHESGLDAIARLERG